MDFLRFLKSLNAIKKRNAEEKMTQAQIAALPNSKPEAWDNFFISLGITPPKHHDLVYAKEMSKEEVDAKMRALMNM